MSGVEESRASGSSFPHRSIDSAVRVGCAGWSLPAAEQPHFPAGESHLARYAQRFSVVEINSSFHRPHRPATYARWEAAVPERFRFSAKLPKTITHQLKLRDAEEPLAQFLQEASGLREKLVALLIQLPPSLAFDEPTARAFFNHLRASTAVALACEPRHATWFSPEAEALLEEFRVARVAADPARVPEAARPGGWRGWSYYRLHGSPKMYYSAYSAEYLDDLAARLAQDAAAGRDVWCIFDNTTLGAAAANALALQERLATFV